MAATVRCPSCDESFPVQDYEGPRVECPSCGTRFDRGPSRGRVPPPLDDRDRAPTAALEPGALPILLRGALLQIVANFLYLLAVLLLMILVLRQLDPSTRTGAGTEKLARLLAVTFALCVIAGWVLNVVAGACWAMAPTRGVSRALGAAALVFAILVLERSTNFMFLLSGPMMPGDGRLGDDPFDSRFTPLYMLSAHYVDLVRMMVLAGYLAAAAGDTGRKGARTSAAVLTIVAPVLLLGPLGLITLVGIVDKIGPDLGPVLLLLMLAGALMTGIWTLAVLFQLRGGWARLQRRARED